MEKKECIHFKRGFCREGENCPYLHTKLKQGNFHQSQTYNQDKNPTRQYSNLRPQFRGRLGSNKYLGPTYSPKGQTSYYNRPRGFARNQRGFNGQRNFRKEAPGSEKKEENLEKENEDECLKKYDKKEESNENKPNSIMQEEELEELLPQVSSTFSIHLINTSLEQFNTQRKELQIQQLYLKTVQQVGQFLIFLFHDKNFLLLYDLEECLFIPEPRYINSLINDSISDLGECFFSNYDTNKFIYINYLSFNHFSLKSNASVIIAPIQILKLETEMITVQISEQCQQDLVHLSREFFFSSEFNNKTNKQTYRLMKLPDFRTMNLQSSQISQNICSQLKEQQFEEQITSVNNFGNLFLIGTQAGNIKIIDFESGQEQIIKKKASSGDIDFICSNKNREKNFVTVSKDGEIQVWDFMQRKHTVSLNQETQKVEKIKVGEGILNRQIHNGFTPEKWRDLNIYAGINGCQNHRNYQLE